MENTELPVITFDTDVTVEKYAFVYQALTKKLKTYTTIYSICGVLICLAVAFGVWVNSLLLDEFYVTFEDGLFFALGLILIGLSVFVKIMRKKGAKNAYDTYLKVTGDSRVHIDFFEDKFIVSNKNEVSTRTYDGICQWAEGDKLFLLYYGKGMSTVALFILKDGFENYLESEKFRALMTRVLPGKKFKKIK